MSTVVWMGLNYSCVVCSSWPNVEIYCLYPHHFPLFFADNNQLLMHSLFLLKTLNWLSHGSWTEIKLRFTPIIMVLVCCADLNWSVQSLHLRNFRYLQSNDSNVPENMVYEYDDFYFCPDPESLIYSHFPEDPKWQLLKQPLRWENLTDGQAVYQWIGERLSHWDDTVLWFSWIWVEVG